MNYNLAIANSLNEANDHLAKARRNLVPHLKAWHLKQAAMLIKLAAYWRGKREVHKGR